MSVERNYTADPETGSGRDATFTPAQQHTTRHDAVKASSSQENARNTNNNGKNGAISARKLEANRRNAQKSTGPRTARGKAVSRFNAVSHGLLARRVMFGANGEVDPALQQLLESLRDRYGTRDIRTELLIEAAVIDYWRNAKGLEYEMKYLGPKGYGFYPQAGIGYLQRYLTANRNALLKDLELLEEQQTSPADVGEAEIADDTDVGDGSAGSKTEDEEESEAA